MSQRKLIVLAAALLAVVRFAAAQPTDADRYLARADAVEDQLRTHVLEPWFPRCVDQKAGGFNSSFDRQWRGGLSDRFAVFQARMVYATSRVAANRPDLREQYLPIVEHGLKYLSDTMWDRTHGGFYWDLSRGGQPKGRTGARKTMYGQSFGLYAAATAYEATRDPAALDLAQRSFAWIEQHARDAEHGGYVEVLDRFGALVPRTEAGPGGTDASGWPVDGKTSNTHLHILEAFTALYRVWPDDLVRQRLQEMLELVRDRMVQEGRWTGQAFTRDLRLIPGDTSYGHDIEGAFLIYDAAAALGIADDPHTLSVVRALIDHTLDFGTTNEGAVLGAGPAGRRGRGVGLAWWQQFEALNALGLAHQLWGDQTHRYLVAYDALWRVVSGPMTDKQFSGHYASVDAAASRDAGALYKGNDWKAAYHEVRCLVAVADRWRAMSEHAPQPTRATTKDE